MLTASDLRVLDCSRRTDFDSRDLPEGVELVEGTVAPGEGLSVRGGTAPPRLRWSAPIAGDDLGSVELLVAGLRRGDLRVRWREWPDGPAGERLVARVDGAGSRRDRFVADLAAQLRPDREYQVEIEPTTVAGEVVSLRRVCFGRSGFSESSIATMARIPWKVTREGEARDSLLVPPSGSIVRTGAVAGDSRLELGIARLDDGQQAIRVEVAGRRDDGPSQVVWSRRYESSELKAGFVEESIDLGRLVGADTELRLTALPESGGPVAVVVGSPRVRTPRRASGRPNIVMISLDTLRADHLSLYGYERETSPHLDRWARSEATTFRNAFAPSGWTLPSHFSVFTGLDAHHHPASYNSIAIDTAAYSFLATELWKAGYSTRAVTGGVFVHPDYGLATGFESFRFWRWRDRLGEEMVSTFRSAVEFLDRMPEEPFLLFVHTYEVHAPNPPREPFHSRLAGYASREVVDFSPLAPDPGRAFLGNNRVVIRDPGNGEAREPGASDARAAVDAYDSAIGFLDEGLAPILERLASEPWSDDTVVVVFSDHGESLGEEGHFGHANLELANLRVPLIVRLPSVDGGVFVETQVRLHDLFSTILELAGVEVPAGVDSRSLAGLLAGRSERSRVIRAYAASTNYGLAVIDPDGLRVDWRNTPWLPVSGEVRWSRVEGSTSTPLTEPPATVRSAEILRDLEADYAARAPGLRLSLENRSGQEVEIQLLSDLVDPVGVKLSRLGAEGFEWRDVGQMSRVLGPDARIELSFERVSSDRVALRLIAGPLQCGRAVERSFSAPMVELRTGKRWSIDLETCPSQSGGALEVELQWVGPVPRQSVAPDAELEKALRALGYL